MRARAWARPCECAESACASAACPATDAHRWLLLGCVVLASEPSQESETSKGERERAEGFPFAHERVLVVGPWAKHLVLLRKLGQTGPCEIWCWRRGSGPGGSVTAPGAGEAGGLYRLLALAAVLLVPVGVRVVELARRERQVRVVAELAVAVVHSAAQQRLRLTRAQRARRQYSKRHGSCADGPGIPRERTHTFRPQSATTATNRR